MDVRMRRHRPAERSGLVTVVVIAALLAPLLSPVIGLDLWGWLPEHGHAGGTSVGAHTHPWDVATDGRTPSPEVAFTAGDLLGAPAVPVPLAVLVALPLLISLLVPDCSSPQRRLVAAVPEPPPPR